MTVFTSVTQQIYAEECANIDKVCHSLLRSAGPWQLIYYEAYLNQTDALGREKYLKSGAGRRFLQTQLRRYLKDYPLRLNA